VFAFLVFSSFVEAEDVYDGDEECGLNESRVGCIPCHRTCQDVNKECLRACALRKKCYCKSGYVRGDDGITCIKETECPNYA